MRRQVDEYMRRQHEILMPSYVLDFSVFVPSTLMARPSVADMLSAGSPAVAAPLRPASGVPTSEAPDYQAVCASLLSAPDIIKWDRLNPTSPGPLNCTPGPHSIDGAANVASNSPILSATQPINNSPVPSAVISAAPCESHSPMAGTVPARMMGSPSFSVPLSSTIVKTSFAATAPFRGFY